MLAAESGVSLEIAESSHLARAAAGAGNRCDYVVGQPDRQRRRRLGGSAAARVTVQTDDWHGDLMISVADSGPGVPENLRQEIFARGVTSKSSTCPATGYRTGVGEAGQRAAWWDRESHRCSNRWRRACSCAAARVQFSSASWPSRRLMRDVLVVDDDFMVAEIHRRFVERVDGFRRGRRCTTGAELRRRRWRPHLILLDVHPPDMTGLEVLQRLRSEGDRVGVIMITAARELDTVSGALDGGAAGLFDQTVRVSGARRQAGGVRRARALSRSPVVSTNR